MGRPPRFPDGMEKREILFPLSLSRRMDAAAQKAGKTMADFVRDAVEREIDAQDCEEKERVGRPLKFGEPTVRREFRFPESLSQQLTQAARERGRDASDLVRDALLAELGGLPGATELENESDPQREKKAVVMGRPLKFNEPLIARQFRLPESLGERLSQHAHNQRRSVSDVLRDAIETELGTPSDEKRLRSVVFDAVSDALRSGIVVQLPDALRDRVQTLAEHVGVHDAATLARLLLVISTTKSVEEVQAFLAGPDELPKPELKKVG